MLTDIYTNKTQQNTAVRLTESTKNILDLLLDLLSISVLLNMHKDANVRNYLFEFIFVLEFNYLRGHRKKSCIIVLKIHIPLYNSQFIYQLMQFVCICSTTSKHFCKT